jgi:uncharacterized protein (DUF58 family)
MFARIRQERDSDRPAPKKSDAPHRQGVEASASELAALRARRREIDLGRPRHVASPIAGLFRSPFRGRGMEFAEVRAYVPGDEVRHIDWRVTARTGKPHSKLFDEEREQPLIVLTDARSSMHFGTQVCFKSVAAAHRASLMVWAAVERGDRVGGVTLTAAGSRRFRLRPGRNGATALITGIADATAAPCDEPETSLADALIEVRRIACVGAQVFLLSDFTDLDAVAGRHLKQLARYTELNCILVQDPLEAELPAPGEYAVSNGKNVIAIGTRGGTSRETWGASLAARTRVLERLCRDCRAGFGALSTAQVAEAHAQGGRRRAETMGVRQ